VFCDAFCICDAAQCGILGTIVPYAQGLRMLKAVMDVAPEPFAFAPLLIILLAAGVAVVVALALVRFVRKGSK
jgi:hypothetical protein